jgi:hypothetical protein
MCVWTLRRSALTGGGTKGACQDREKLHVKTIYLFTNFLASHFQLLVLIALYIDTDRFLVFFNTNASLNLGQRSSCDRNPDEMHLDKVKTEPSKSRVDPSIEMDSDLVLKAQNR